MDQLAAGAVYQGALWFHGRDNGPDVDVAWRKCQPDATAAPARRLDKAGMRQLVGDLHQMGPRDVLMFGHCRNGHALTGVLCQIDEQSQGIIGVAGELHGAELAEIRDCCERGGMQINTQTNLIHLK